MVQRNLSIDLIKIVAMLGVICLHTTYKYIEPGTFGFADVMYESAVISIPLFFMVSGYLLFGRENVNYRYVLGKVLKIIRFVFIITFSFWAIHSLHHKDVDVLAFLRLFSGSFLQKSAFGVFWYLGAMVIIYSILPLLNGLWRYRITYFYILTVCLFLTSIGFFLSNLVSEGETSICQTFRLWNWLFYFNLGGVIKSFTPPLQAHAHTCDWCHFDSKYCNTGMA